MKKIFFILFILALTATEFSCKKIPISVNNYKSDTIILSDKSIDTIKKYIAGKWEIYYTSSNWSSDSHSNYFVEFKFNDLLIDSINIKANAVTYVNDKFMFKKYRIYANADITKDTTYCIEFTPTNYIINEIWYAAYTYRDTLILKQTFTDGVTFYCKKIK